MTELFSAYINTIRLIVVLCLTIAVAAIETTKLQDVMV